MKRCLKSSSAVQGFVHLCIEVFKNKLINIATDLLESVKKLLDSTDNDTDVFISDLEFPSYIDFGYYKGWLLESGESRHSHRLRMQSWALQSRNRNEIMFIDIDEE